MIENRTVAFHTLGCKVNQYDTQAMRERFEEAGFRTVDFEDRADVYVVNTCTVTGTGDKKSMQTIRRCHRNNPNAAIVVTGCLAQRAADELKLPGVRLVLGTQRRGEVVQLLAQALEQDCALIAVETLRQAPFEHLTVHAHEGHTRATMKIQEGCDRWCTYCIIPSVRGPIRSRPLDEIRAEAQSLAAAGFKEVVLTGIHLTSYGREQHGAITLLDAIRAVHEVEGIERIRGTMAALRHDCPAEFGGVPVETEEDLRSGICRNLVTGGEQPAAVQGADILRYSLVGGAWICVRPSGTEPKLKLYIGANAAEEAGVDALLKQLTAGADARLKTLLGLC